jgi:RNA polymerase sigma-70 factor (ECF subfamily)
MLKDEQAAEDTVQDTFLNAFKGLEQFDGRSTLGTWLFRIAYNNALMRLRSQKPTEMLDEDAESGEGVPTPIVVPWRETPEDIVTRGETAARLEEAIAELPETLRTVFQLRDVEERSTAETAEILGLGESAVKVRLHRARLRLREKLNGYFATEAEPRPASMTCEELTPYLSEYIDNAIEEPLAAAAREHIGTCPRCHILLDTTQKTITLMQQGKMRVIPVADRAALFKEIKNAFAARRAG